MKNNCSLVLGLIVLACMSTQCALPEINDECSVNIDGAYARDEFEDYTLQTSISKEIAKKGFCVDDYSHCIVVAKENSERYICSACDSGEVWVSLSDGSHECKTCDEILEKVTEDENYKKIAIDKCNYVECEPGCRDGHVTECEGSRPVIKACMQCNDDGLTCMEGAACKEHQKLDNGVCACDIERRWVDDGKGGCRCENGFEENGDQCTSIVKCQNGAVMNPETLLCECDSANHWIGEANTCYCEDGYKQIGNECKSNCSKGEVFDSELNCRCDTDNHWTGQTGSCQCEAGYFEYNGNCALIQTCNSNEYFNQGTNRCECKTEEHWVGTAGSCQCASGFTNINGSCQSIKQCAWNEELDLTVNECRCKNSDHWVGTAGNCQCEGGYINIGNTCQLKKVCGSAEINQNNICVCDTSRHYTGTAGACGCAFGYHQSGNSCVGYNVGDRFVMGNYYGDISWIVLTASSNEYYIISEKIIEAMKHNTAREYIAWNDSLVKKWLDGLKNYLPAEAQGHIKSISLLSKGEASSFFPTDDKRKAQATPHAVSTKLSCRNGSTDKVTSDGSCSGTCYGWWWLRDQGASDFLYQGVKTDGSFPSNGMNVDDLGGIRPVIKLSY